MSKEGIPMSRGRASRVATYAVIGGALLVLSCGGEDVREPEPFAAPVVEPTLEVIEDEPAVRLPENFPEDLPIYPHVDRTLGSKADKRAMGAMFESTKPPEEVFQYYQNKLVEQGWEIQGEINLGDQRALNVRKGDEVASVLINYQDGKTQITLLTGKDPGAGP
jgi:hypothetical protein